MAIPTKHHHTSSAASGGGVPVDSNPAYDIKHPNFCPQCGESLTAPNFRVGAQLMPDGPLGNLQPTGAPPSLPPSGGPAITGLSEMLGSPAMGAAGLQRKAKKKAKSKPSKPTPKKGLH
ncbi:MAG TPA: hypothetical protein VNS88_15850 [Nitrospiraceae bacterium]|nr:hypothetical protein [Nitrospiraceae bacterium]